MHFTCLRCRRRIKVHKSRDIKCVCGNTIKYEDCFGKKQGIYLLDANIFIYAEHNDAKHGNACNAIINDANMATTDLVISELDELNPRVRVYKLKIMTEDVRRLRTDFLKNPSLQDLSLIQVAIDNPEIIGIITYDGDFKKIASAGIVQSKSGYRDKFFVGTPEEYFQKEKKR